MKIRFAIACAIVFSTIGFGYSSNFRAAETAGGTFNSYGKCAIPSFQEAFRQSKVVFSGEIVGEKKEGDVRRFQFKVDKFWKGKAAKRLEILVYETTRYQAWFENGGKYLIYASAGDDGKFYVGRCSRSRGIDSAAEDLQRLGRGKSPR